MVLLELPYIILICLQCNTVPWILEQEGTSDPITRHRGRGDCWGIGRGALKKDNDVGDGGVFVVFVPLVERFVGFIGEKDTFLVEGRYGCYRL